MSATAEATWRIVGGGSVPSSEPYFLGMMPAPLPRGQYFSVAAPESDQVVAEVEFDDREGVNYFDAKGMPTVGLTVRARGDGGEFAEVISGSARLPFLGDETFILQAAQLGVAAARLENPADVAAELEALMN